MLDLKGGNYSVNRITRCNSPLTPKVMSDGEPLFPMEHMELYSSSAIVGLIRIKVGLTPPPRFIKYIIKKVRGQKENLDAKTPTPHFIS